MSFYTSAVRQACFAIGMPETVQVWLFGSCLWSSSPRDVDLLLVTDDPRAAVEVSKVELSSRIRERLGLSCDYVTLSRAEETSVRFASSEAAVWVWPTERECDERKLDS